MSNENEKYQNLLSFVKGDKKFRNLKSEDFDVIKDNKDVAEKLEKAREQKEDTISTISLCGMLVILMVGIALIVYKWMIITYIMIFVAIVGGIGFIISGITYFVCMPRRIYELKHSVYQAIKMPIINEIYQKIENVKQELNEGKISQGNFGIEKQKLLKYKEYIENLHKEIYL